MTQPLAIRVGLLQVTDAVAGEALELTLFAGEVLSEELENGALWWNTDYVLGEVDGDMMIEVKR